MIWAQNGEDEETQSRYFETTSDGLIVRRMNLTDPYDFPTVDFKLFGCSLETYYFYRVNGQYLGSYAFRDNNEVIDDASVLLNWVQHGQRNGAGKELGILHGNDPGGAISFDPLTGAYQNDQAYGNHDYFSDIPKTYICVAGDTYVAIAEKIYGDSSLASYIDAANGGGALIAGQTIVIPQLIVMNNRAGMARPYYQLLQIIQGSLTPHLDTPQPQQDDDDFFGLLICAIAVVVICVYPPAVAAVASVAGTLGVSVPVMTGVAAGLADAAAQELCVGIGLKDHFSLTESVTAGITAGFASGFGGAALGEETVMTMVRMGMVNVSEQLTEMAIGIRQQFDIAGVALAMGSAGLSAKINIDNPLERRLVSDVAVAGMSSVVRGHFDVENLATQLITDAAAVGMQQWQTKQVSDEYHQSKKASQGAGHITQTTIEQQWESQLINDAEFTANAQLPSVTFDVNNSYVSQQLGQRVGEEVSHFYHPTPPPRNPSGFWQRVEQRYKNNFERQALIAEGRAAANSEAMSESLGQASANQQHYLDLGYTDSVAQTGAAWIGMAEVPAAKSIQLGKQATRLLAENWGFFGHNGTESSRFLSSIERVSSNVINKGFITEKALAEGWKPPYPDNISLRKITTAQEIKLYRVHTEADWPVGQFLAREKEITPFLNDPEALRLHLGLPDVPIYITEVNIPTNTELYVGRIGPQPSFGLIDKSGYQYQTVGKLPESSFVNTRPILRPSLNLDMGY